MNCANHPDRERLSFCQNCGKPLCNECTRPVGAAVFCEPCLAARLAAADAATASAAAPSQGTPYGNVNVPPTYAAAPPSAPGAPNPILAGALGFIPGVGAMYNGQYAKGVVHLIVFAVLVSLKDANEIFGLLVAGWIIYQAFEAYHTARARRDGTPLPNPFGLNEIGDKFGFGKSWPAAPTTPHVPVADPLYRPGTTAPFTSATYSNPGPDAPGAPGFNQAHATSHPFTPPPAPPAGGWSTPPYPGYGAPPPNQPFVDSFVNSTTDASLNPPANRFPTGAVILIALGLLFFFGSSGFFRHFPVQRVIPFLLIALGVWLFVRKMVTTGAGLGDDGSPAYQMRLFRALRGSVWIILVGILFLLDTFDILSWGHSWPLFIIVAGLMAFFQSAVYRSAAATPYAYSAPGTYTPPAPSTAPTTSTAIVPVTPHDEEGR